MGKVRDVGIHTLNHPAAIAFFAEEIVVKCEVKPDEDIYIYIKAFRLKAIVKIYIVLILQSQRYFSKVLNV